MNSPFSAWVGVVVCLVLSLQSPAIPSAVGLGCYGKVSESSVFPQIFERTKTTVGVSRHDQIPRRKKLIATTGFFLEMFFERSRNPGRWLRSSKQLARLAAVFLHPQSVGF